MAKIPQTRCKQSCCQGRGSSGQGRRSLLVGVPCAPCAMVAPSTTRGLRARRQSRAVDDAGAGRIHGAFRARARGDRRPGPHPRPPQLRVGSPPGRCRKAGSVGIPGHRSCGLGRRPGRRKAESPRDRASVAALRARVLRGPGCVRCGFVASRSWTLAVSSIMGKQKRARRVLRISTAAHAAEGVRKCSCGVRSASSRPENCQTKFYNIDMPPRHSTQPKPDTKLTDCSLGNCCLWVLPTSKNQS